MMKTGKLLAFLLSSSILSIPIAYADNFTIINQSSYNLSFAVNNTCSQIIGNVNAMNNKSFPEATFRKVCGDKCEVEVYDNRNCDGLLMAYVKYDLKRESVDLYSNGVHNVAIGVSGLNTIYFQDPVNKK